MFDTSSSVNMATLKDIMMLISNRRNSLLVSRSTLRILIWILRFDFVGLTNTEAFDISPVDHPSAPNTKNQTSWEVCIELYCSLLLHAFVVINRKHRLVHIRNFSVGMNISVYPSVGFIII